MILIYASKISGGNKVIQFQLTTVGSLIQDKLVRRIGRIIKFQRIPGFPWTKIEIVKAYTKGSRKRTNPPQNHHSPLAPQTPSKRTIRQSHPTHSVMHNLTIYRLTSLDNIR